MFTHRQSLAPQIWVASEPRRIRMIELPRASELRKIRRIEPTSNLPRHSLAPQIWVASEPRRIRMPEPPRASEPRKTRRIEPTSNLLRAMLYRSTARGKARIRWPVAADSRRDGAIVAKDSKGDHRRGWRGFQPRQLTIDE